MKKLTNDKLEILRRNGYEWQGFVDGIHTFRTDNWRRLITLAHFSGFSTYEDKIFVPYRRLNSFVKEVCGKDTLEQLQNGVALLSYPVIVSIENTELVYGVSYEDGVWYPHIKDDETREELITHHSVYIGSFNRICATNIIQLRALRNAFENIKYNMTKEA